MRGRLLRRGCSTAPSGERGVGELGEFGVAELPELNGLKIGRDGEI
jgi:hypothetical protein